MADFVEVEGPIVQTIFVRRINVHKFLSNLTLIAFHSKIEPHMLTGASLIKSLLLAFPPNNCQPAVQCHFN